MAKYRSLAKLFHMDASNERFANNEKLAISRLQAESTFRTSIVTDLGELFLAVPRELTVLNETILKRERQVAVALANLPAIAVGATIRSLVIDEVVCSNELEGVHSTRRQINDLLESAPNDSGTFGRKRFRELARLYFELSDEKRVFPQTPEDIRTVYDHIMAGENLGEDAPDGVLFRKKAVDIVVAGSKVVHSGLMPESRIITAMSKMIALASSPEIPEVYAAIISHFLFEYAHPFYDGNGRTGRYLLALYLSRPLSTLTPLSVSRAIAEGREAYYRAFREVENPLNHGELTPFVLTMMEYIDTAQQHMLSDLETKGAQFKVVRANLDKLVCEHGLKEKEGAALFMLAQFALFGSFPDVPLRALSDYLGLKDAMTRRYTRSLEEKGLVSTLSTRPLRFALSKAAMDELGIDGVE